jgi:Ti-type conjugative transfer relaxase TraA
MAIAHFSAQIIGSDRSPVAAAAYRHRTTMREHGVDTTFGYARDVDLVHTEIAVPANAPTWVRELLAHSRVESRSEALWNAVVDCETRRDGQYAREINIALPKELTVAQNIALMREFVATELTARGLIVDWVFHNKPDNPHVHLMHTVRALGATGFGQKNVPVLDADGQQIRRGKLLAYVPFIGGKEDFRALRLSWGATATRHLAANDFAAVVDMRSYMDQGLTLTPTSHRGQAVCGLVGKGQDSDVAERLAAEIAATVAKIEHNPTVLLEMIVAQTATFLAADISRHLLRYVTDKTTSDRILARVMASPELLTRRPDVYDPESRRLVAKAVYTTRSMQALEASMIDAAGRLQRRGGHAVSQARVDAAIRAVEGADPAKPFTLAVEQVEAIQAVTGDASIACVVGIAGSGKSTMLEVAHRAWRAADQRVCGAALSGKAAEGLQQSSGIASRTLASWELAWSRGQDGLRRGDIFVIDEAGMVPTRQMAVVVGQVRASGAKLVLVGDAEQLQPIDAGAAFRAITERVGRTELSEVRRQRTPWQRLATQQFWKGDAKAALAGYRAAGAIQTPVTKADAITAMVADYMTAYRRLAAPTGTELMMLAHTNVDVLALNRAARAAFQATGKLADEQPFVTARGERQFAPGDRIIFLENRRFQFVGAPEFSQQRVNNGMLGTVTKTTADVGGTVLHVRLDNGKTVAFDSAVYANVDYGYAATVHKNQGVTVDQAFVLATASMDRHLGYVAMSRHRDHVTVYAPADAFQRRTLEQTWSQAQPKTNVADYGQGDEFLARRGIQTATDMLAGFAAVVAAKRDDLAAVWQRAKSAMVAVQTPAVVPKAAPTVLNTDQSVRPNLLQRGLAAGLTAIGITASKQPQAVAVEPPKSPHAARITVVYDEVLGVIKCPYVDQPIQLLKDLATWSDDKAAFVIKPGASLQYLPAVMSFLQNRIDSQAANHACAEKIIAAYQSSQPERAFDLQLKADNGRLQFVIPAHVEPARAIALSVNAQFDAAQNCWTVAVDHRRDTGMLNTLSGIAAAVAAAEQRPSLAKTIVSPDDRIVLTTDGDKLFARLPYMPSTNQIIKAAGFVSDHASNAFVAVIKGPTDLATATTAFAAVVESYDRALVPPTTERRGIHQPPKIVADLLALPASEAARSVGADQVLNQAVVRFLNHVISAVPFAEQKLFEQVLKSSDVDGIADKLGITAEAAEAVAAVCTKLQTVITAVDMAREATMTRGPERGMTW